MTDPAIDEVPTRRVPPTPAPAPVPVETVPLAAMPTPAAPVPVLTAEVQVVASGLPSLPVDALGRAVDSRHIAAEDADACRRQVALAGQASRDAAAMVALGKGLISPAQLARLSAERDPDDPPTQPTMLVTRKTTTRVARSELARASKRLKRLDRHGVGAIKFQARVGEYYLLEVLGRGGMGRVVKAHRRGLDRQVALKFVDPEDGEVTPAILATFANEARVAAQLDHPGIVRVLDVSLEAACPYVAFEFVSGRTLSVAIKARELDAARSVRIAAELARALEHCHAREILHRDLKPSNVLLHVRSDRARLIDFGLATRLRLGSAPCGRFGTVNHMSPEQLLGNDLTPASDVFALGTVLYEMFAGARLFDGEGHQQIAERVCAAHVPGIPGVDPRVDAILRAMLALEPDARPTAGEVAGQLEALLAPGGAAGPYGEGDGDAGPRLTPSPRERARLPLAVSALTLVAVCLGIALFVARLRLDQREEALMAAREQAGLVARGLEDGLARALQAVERGDARWEAMRVAERAGKAELAETERAAAEAAYDTAAPRLAAAARAGALLPGSIERAIRAREVLASLRSRRLHRARIEGDEHAARRLTAGLAALGIYDVDGRGAVEIHTEPPAARMSVHALVADGRGRLTRGALLARGTSPLTAHVPPGRVLVEVRAPRCLPVSETLYVGWRDRMPVRLRLVERDTALPDHVAIAGGLAALGGRPLRWVETAPVLMAVHEVTAAEYLAFLQATGQTARAPRRDGQPLWPSSGPAIRLPAGWPPERPVSDVSFDDARAYCRWRSETTRQRVRLPHADEWERAARGCDSRPYPWGLRYDRGLCYVRGEGPRLSPPSKVGLAPGDVSPTGVRDLAGSMREWVEGWYDEALGQRLVRGGSYRTGAAAARPARRAGMRPEATASDVGFRVVVEVAR